MNDRRTKMASLLPSRPRNWLLLVLAIGLLVLLITSISGSGEPEPEGGPPMVRRLTEEQYRNSIADIFAPDIEITGRFEPPFRSHGLISVGTGAAGISPFAVEQYEISARGIAASVFSEKRRDRFLDCRPSDPDSFDEKCARSFLGEKGRMLFRRPLTPSQLSHYVDLSRQAAGKMGGFHRGLEMGLYSMLVAPEFLFRVEHPATDANGNTGPLDPYSKAERLSFFLINSTPDAELLDAAENGDLDSLSGIEEQADRLIESESYVEGLRSFFSDFLEFDRFDELSKDPEIYPAFNSDLAADAQEQTLRTIIDHLYENDGDYRDLFTLRDTVLTRSLGVVYRTPVPSRQGWEPVRFAPDAKRAGIQSHISFLALHAHPGRSSPTLRGYSMRQVFLCQEVPDPPANVNFTAIEEHVEKANVTARDRLDIHSTEPSCAGCHKVMDPIGFALEAYDGIGAFRTHENGKRIDLSGDLDGTAFEDTDDLALALRDHPETPRCLAQRMYTSAVGRDIGWTERYYLDWLIASFVEDDFNVPALMRRIATSENFYTVKVPTKKDRRKVAISTRNQGEGS